MLDNASQGPTRQAPRDESLDERLAGSEAGAEKNELSKAGAQRDVTDERAAGLEAGAEDDEGWRVDKADTQWGAADGRAAGLEAGTGDEEVRAGRAKAQRGALGGRATSSCCTLEIGLKLEPKVK